MPTAASRGVTEAGASAEVGTGQESPKRRQAVDPSLPIVACGGVGASVAGAVTMADNVGKAGAVTTAGAVAKAGAVATAGTGTGAGAGDEVANAGAIAIDCGGVTGATDVVDVFGCAAACVVAAEAPTATWAFSGAGVGAMTAAGGGAVHACSSGAGFANGEESSAANAVVSDAAADASGGDGSFPGGRGGGVFGGGVRMWMKGPSTALLPLFATRG